MGYFLGPLGNFFRSHGLFFWTPRQLFQESLAIFVGLSTTRAGESANRLQTGSEVRFESADPAVRYDHLSATLHWVRKSLDFQDKLGHVHVSNFNQMVWK